jgi:hypothetical protein
MDGSTSSSSSNSNGNGTRTASSNITSTAAAPPEHDQRHWHTNRGVQKAGELAATHTTNPAG